MIRILTIKSNFKKRISIILGVAVIVGFGLIIIKRQIDDKEIKDYQQITFATVNKIGWSSGAWFDCFYYVNGERYEGSFKLFLGLKKAELLLNKSFPVVYSKKNPFKHQILVYPNEFKDFGIEYPDSLNWVRQLIEK